MGVEAGEVVAGAPDNRGLLIMGAVWLDIATKGPQRGIRLPRREEVGTNGEMVWKRFNEMVNKGWYHDVRRLAGPWLEQWIVCRHGGDWDRAVEDMRKWAGYEREETR